MSGKSYTMREMKAIVEYLNTNKAYGEIRGRKLWTDFASTKVTSRTWQSLKETFLKRILPDIHNPYYGLTKSEICSFKQGYDVDKRIQNKLDIQTISDDSNHSNAGNGQDNEKTSTSNNVDAEKPTGENSSPTPIEPHTRASTETVILDNCYKTCEDIQRDLESPNSDKTAEGKKDAETSPIKTVRDMITYAEPLTPMMQQVLDDFTSEDELVEADLVIVEDTNNQDKELNNEQSKVGEESLKINKEVDKSSDKIEDRLSEIVHCSDSIKIPLGQETQVAENSTRKSSDLIQNSENIDNSQQNNKVSNGVEKEKIQSVFNLTNETVTTQNTNNSSDIIPGNQEAMKDKDKPIEPSNIKNTIEKVSQNRTVSRKRPSSQDSKPIEKKKKLGLKNKKASLSGPEDNENSDFKFVKTIPEKTKGNKSVPEDNENSSDLIIVEQIPGESYGKDDETKKQATNDSQEKIKITFEENSQINPCLNSVSLYVDEFNKTKYSHSDDTDVEYDPTVNVAKEKSNEDKKAEVNKPNLLKKATLNEVVILKSHSESDDSKEDDNQDKMKRAADKKERHNALASLFGFSSGAVSTSHNRRLSRRHRSPTPHNATNSSEWTSESDNEFVSPPRGRRNRHSRKYLKPKSSRVLSLGDEGGLFVLHSKRIYPMVDINGKVVKNCVKISSESDPEEDPTYWKKKYKEERQKTEELKKLVNVAKTRPIRAESPVFPTTSRQSTVPRSPPELVPIHEAPLLPAIEKPREEKSIEKILKIKFTKNNGELHLEGSWSQIHPVLADVVEIFNKDSDTKEPPRTENKMDSKPPIKENGEASPGEVLSLSSSPVDEEDVRKKVEKMEEEIFKEIEELEKSEREQERANVSDQDANINKRRRVGRPRKSSLSLKSADSSSSPSRPKRTKTLIDVKETVTNDQELAVIKRTKTAKDAKETTASPRQLVVTKKMKTAKDVKETTASPQQLAVKRTKTVKDVKETTASDQQIAVSKRMKTVKDVKETTASPQQLEVKDLLKRQSKPPKKYSDKSTNEKQKTPKKSLRKSTNAAPETTKHLSVDDPEVRYMFPPVKTHKVRKSANETQMLNSRSSKNPAISTFENLSLNSIDSTQGYQDSDDSPSKEMINLKRKRKFSLSIISHRGKYERRRHVRRKSYPCVSDDASSESSNMSSKREVKNSSRSSVYRSESYQLLLPIKKRSYQALAKIDEVIATNNNDVYDKNALKINVEDYDIKNVSTGSVNVQGNSSNVSLPESPELSIVENISISKELINSIEGFPTINETQANNEPNLTAPNKYLMSAVDVTMPLMGQDCNIQKRFTPNHDKSPVASESLVNRINSVNINEAPSISDSLDNRLRNLLLESAKKMEVDTLGSISEKNDTEINKKVRAKKRCSTPHKRSKQKPKIPAIEPVVEEERMEFCSRGGRKSCPPTIQLLPDIDNNNENDLDNTPNKPVKKARKKKDIIKVKILKPSNKRKRVSPAKAQKTDDASTISAHTDSGINETGSVLFLQDTDDSVDLIHNHSETCLQTKECVGDSIEFVDRDMSVISIDSQDVMQFKEADNLPPEMFCSNAHDGGDMTGSGNVISIYSQSTGETIYHSPIASELSGNSLITEDLSDEMVNKGPNLRQNNKWFLFSDDEATNTNQVPSFGSNLMQIFPLTCAVPDLSTITEMSKENDSRKPTMDNDGDTRNDLESQSMF